MKNNTLCSALVLVLFSLIWADFALALRYAARVSSPVSIAELAQVHNVDGLETLLLGRDINGGDENGNTPVYNSIILNRIDLAVGLIARGADLELANVFGQTPFRAALMTQNPFAVRLLLETMLLQALNAQVDQLVPTLAITDARLLHIMNHLTAFRDYMLTLDNRLDDGLEDQEQNHGYVREFVVLNTHRNYAGEPEILEDSARHAMLLAVTMILTNGTPQDHMLDALNRPNHEGRTPLHHFIQVQRVAGVNLLLRLGAALDIPDAQGVTPFALAMNQGADGLRDLVLFEFILRAALGVEARELTTTNFILDMAWLHNVLQLYFFPVLIEPVAQVQTLPAPSVLPVLLPSAVSPLRLLSRLWGSTFHPLALYSN